MAYTGTVIGPRCRARAPGKHARPWVTRTFNVSNSTPMEEVEVRIIASHSRNGDLQVYVTSPGGYTSRLAKSFSGSGGANPLNWSYTTNALWGENPAGTWTVKVADVVSGTTGTWTSYRVVVHMGELILAVTGPTITQQPSPQNVCPGSTATFTVAAIGTGTLSYQWQRNGANITNGGRISGATTASLTIVNVDNSDVGDYGCVVIDSSDSKASNSAALSLGTTVITADPASQTVSQNQTATFKVSAAGKGTLTYQWQKNGASLTNGKTISGATSPTLKITKVALSDQGSYRCMVKGDCGTAISNEAELTVQARGKNRAK